MHTRVCKYSLWHFSLRWRITIGKTDSSRSRTSATSSGANLSIGDSRNQKSGNTSFRLWVAPEIRNQIPREIRNHGTPRLDCGWLHKIPRERCLCLWNDCEETLKTKISPKRVHLRLCGVQWAQCGMTSRRQYFQICYLDLPLAGCQGSMDCYCFHSTG